MRPPTRISNRRLGEIDPEVVVERGEDVLDVNRPCHHRTGFDFLGYRFQSGRRLRPAKQSLERLLTRSRRLYEQGATRARLWRYVERWVEWLWGGLGRIVSRKGGRRTYWVYILKRLAIPKAVRPRRDTPRRRG